MSLRETIGDAIGRAWAAPVAAISAARRARMFHPRGVLFAAHAEPSGEGPLAELGQRLAGPLLARFSGALFKPEVRHLEVLGLALRFSTTPAVDARPQEADQDLLFATIISPFTMPLSPLTTTSDDYLANRYWAVSPFEVTSLGRLKFRVRPLTPPSEDSRERRGAKLAHAVETRPVQLVLEARRTLRRGWQAIATLHLDRPSDIDQEALRFDPFRSGRGIVPAGLVHRIRRDVYAASQRARPATAASA